MVEDGLVCKSMMNISKTELKKKVIKLAYMKTEVGDVEFKNVTYRIPEKTVHEFLKKNTFYKTWRGVGC